jgi:hypothetical protein
LCSILCVTVGCCCAPYFSLSTNRPMHHVLGVPPQKLTTVCHFIAHLISAPPNRL